MSIYWHHFYTVFKEVTFREKIIKENEKFKLKITKPVDTCFSPWIEFTVPIVYDFLASDLNLKPINWIFVCLSLETMPKIHKLISQIENQSCIHLQIWALEETTWDARSHNIYVFSDPTGREQPYRQWDITDLH